jgi:hypothetical protein
MAAQIMMIIGGGAVSLNIMTHAVGVSAFGRVILYS